MGLFEEIIEEKRTIKVGNQDVTLDPSLMVFTEATVNTFLEKSAVYIEYFGRKLADADAEQQYHDSKVDAVYAQKFVTYKDEGGSDKLCESKVQADPDYQKVRENSLVARHKKKLSVFKVQRVNVSLVVVGNHIMAIGGNSFRDGEYMVNKEVDEYDPISNNWIPKAPLPEPLTRSNALFKDREVHLFGGSGLYENNPKAINNQHLVYNLETNNWRVENSLPYEVFGHRCTHQNGKIIIVGGTNRLPNPSRKVFIEK